MCRRSGEATIGSVEVSVRIHDDGVDGQQLDDLTRRLRDELIELDVAVDGVRAGDAPAGARSIELAAVGTLLVTLSQSAVLAAIVNAVATWLGQRRQRTVKVEVDGDVLELSGAASPEQRELLDAWLGRRAAAAGSGERRFADRRQALIVASHDYQDAGLRRLRAPAHDAEQLARVLRDPKIGGFDVRTMMNASAASINEAVEDFFADRDPDELLLLYFSGHGVKDEDGELYFAAANTKLNRLGASAVAADFVNRRMNRSRSRRIVLLLDCCYAGAFGRAMVARAGTGIAIEEQFGGRGRAVITASSAMEYAFEGQDLADTRDAGPSVFTSALVDGLDSGDADRDQDGFIGLDELYEYVYERVRQATPNQTPGKWTFDVQGDLHIARRSRPVTTPSPLPDELQEAVDHPLSGIRAGAVGELGRLLNSRHGGLALAAKLALERLANDDSRSVSAEAAAVLGPPAPAPATVPTPAPIAPATLVRAATTAPSECQAAPPRERPPAIEPVVSAPMPPAPAPTGPARPRRSRARSAVTRVGLAVSAAALAVGWSSVLRDSHYGGQRDISLWTLRDVQTIWGWSLIAAVLVLVLAAPGGRVRPAAQAAALGLTTGLAGLIVSIATNSAPVGTLTIGFWVLLGGTALALIGTALDLSADASRRDRVANRVYLAVGIAAAGLGVVAGLGLVVAASVLLVLAVVRAVRQWRVGPSKAAVALGLGFTVLLVGDAALAWFDGVGREVLRWPYLPVLVMVVLIGILIADDHPVRPAVARVTVVVGLLLQIPLYGLTPFASAGLLPHTLLEVAAGACAVGALAAYRRTTADGPEPVKLS
jgi:hypothetical protein